MGKQLETLKQHLIKKEWRSADWQTKWALMELAGKSQGNLTPDEVKNISYSDLLEIDHLWNEADSRFGFRKQAILMNLDDYENFVQRVGWRRNGEWRAYDDIFEGHFVDGQLPYIGSRFWERELILFSHSHLPHRHAHAHAHQPHHFDPRHGGAGLGIGGALAAAAAAAPWILGGAAVVGGGYLLYRWVTKEEREREERRERERQEELRRKERERQEELRRKERERQEELTKKGVISLLDPFLVEVKELPPKPAHRGLYLSSR